MSVCVCGNTITYRFAVIITVMLYAWACMNKFVPYVLVCECAAFILHWTSMEFMCFGFCSIWNAKYTAHTLFTFLRLPKNTHTHTHAESKTQRIKRIPLSFFSSSSPFPLSFSHTKFDVVTWSIFPSHVSAVYMWMR